jgi:hypothetical protein
MGVVSNGLFLLLVAVNVTRTLRHSMWRDEMEVFMLATGSPSLWDLFLKLKYEAHPGLWHTLVWLLTCFTSDPKWMQVLHIALAIGAWVIIYRWSPFGRAEKILLLLSYFLFWEYFVISRSYVLLALIGFAFVALRQHRPQQDFIPWLLLGLLANVHLLGAIWSMAMAAALAIDGARCKPAYVAGGAVYLCLLGFAIVTMIPAPDYGPWAADVRFEPSRFNSVLGVPLGAFVPTELGLVRNVFAFLANPGTGAIPRFWNSNPAVDLVSLTQADTDHPLRLALVFAVPVATCWLITRNPLRVLEFFLVYVGILLFTNIWNFPGDARHHGAVFLAFIGSVWAARSQRSPTIWSSRLLMALLAINAFSGVLTLMSELRPFSQARSAGAWIKQNNLADQFLVGSRDAQVSSVTGYLGRPIYYLECECRGTFIVWNGHRQSPLSFEQFGRRLATAVGLAEDRDVLLIRNRPVAPEDLNSSVPSLSVTLLREFADAITDENYWIYRVSRTPRP